MARKTGKDLQNTFWRNKLSNGIESFEDAQKRHPQYTEFQNRLSNLEKNNGENFFYKLERAEWITNEYNFPKKELDNIVGKVAKNLFERKLYMISQYFETDNINMAKKLSEEYGFSNQKFKEAHKTGLENQIIKAYKILEDVDVRVKGNATSRNKQQRIDFLAKKYKISDDKLNSLREDAILENALQYLSILREGSDSEERAIEYFKKHELPLDDIDKAREIRMNNLYQKHFSKNLKNLN